MEAERDGARFQKEEEVMEKQNQSECRCSKTSRGCAAARARGCACGERCTCMPRCECGADCACTNTK